MERKQKHILETARTLFFQANLPLKFWGEYVQCAVHLINRIPLMVLKEKTPYECMFGKKPDLTHLRVFGCLCFISTLKRNRHKLMQRAQRSVFIGYEIDKKGYKVYNLETKTVIVSKDVVFYEHHFLFHYEKQNSKVSAVK